VTHLQLQELKIKPVKFMLSRSVISMCRVAHLQIQELKIKPVKSTPSMSSHVHVPRDIHCRVAHLQLQELKIKPVKSTLSRTVMSMCRVIFTVAWLTSSSRN
jgi:hypothetical protein